MRKRKEKLATTSHRSPQCPCRFAEELRGLRGQVEAGGEAALGVSRHVPHLRALPALAHGAEDRVRRHADAAAAGPGRNAIDVLNFGPKTGEKFWAQFIPSEHHKF